MPAQIQLNSYSNDKIADPVELEHLVQGWTAPAKPTGMTPWSRHGQRPCRGSPGILLFELVLCIALPGAGPGKIHHC